MTSNPLADRPEWAREKPRRLWDPGRRLLQTIRKYQTWGERVLGDVVVRDYSKIGANAVAISSFPAASVLVGSPARRVGQAKKARPGKLRTRSRARFAAGQN